MSNIFFSYCSDVLMLGLALVKVYSFRFVHTQFRNDCSIHWPALFILGVLIVVFPRTVS